MLTPEVQECANRSVLCWLATVDADGRPSVSPKEIFAVFDSSYLVIAHIASPTSVRNIGLNRHVCASFIDVFVQKGFKVQGTARVVSRNDPEFLKWGGALVAKAGPRFPVRSVMVIEAIKVERILAPSYRLYADETTEESQVATAMRSYGVAPASTPNPQP